MANVYPSNDTKNFKFSDKELELLRDSCLDDSTKIISYLEDKFQEQAKSQNTQFIINLIFVILTLIVSIIALLK